MAEPVRLRREVIEGTVIVSYGPAAVFCYDVRDLGMRNLALVAITNAGMAVKDVAKVFDLTDIYVSEIRGRARDGGSAGLVKTMGRPAKLTARQSVTIRGLFDAGMSQSALARKYKVSRPVIADALAASPGPMTPTSPSPDAEMDSEKPDAETEVEVGVFGDGAPDPEPLARRDFPGTAFTPDLDPDPVPGAGGPSPRAGSGRIEVGEVACRYAGAMLAHAFFTRIGAGKVFASLDTSHNSPATGRRRTDDSALLCAVSLMFALGSSSIESAKHLDRTSAGALAGLNILPELRTLRPRLAKIADACDALAVQRTLATAMLTADAPALGIYYVDDHFVPYGGAKPVGKGWNTKRKTAMPGHGDTLLSDHRGRAVAFLTGEPSGLTKTLPPVLKQLRQILGPAAPILLGFDRGGAYASVFTECQKQNVDWITYRRGKLTPTTTTQPQGHTYVDGHAVATRVLLCDEQVEFADYGTCRQLTLFEHGKPVLQVLTSDTEAPAAALLTWLRARWRIENAFKDLAHNYGIDWLCDYSADLIPDTTPIPNPTRTAAKKLRDQAKADHDTAQKTLAALSTTSTIRPITALNQQITTAQHHLTKTAATLHKHEQNLKKIPAKIPANHATPGLMRALPATKRRTLQMVLRLLAYNSELFLADHLNTYLKDPNEYRAHTRTLLSQPGTITYTPTHITVTITPTNNPHLTRALTHLTEELNHTPPHLPGDHRPINYHITPN
jgi:Transposase DDE domain